MMRLFSTVVAVVGMVWGHGALAQDTVDEGLFGTGETLFNDNCAFCHRENGEGDPPNFPALAGNVSLGDLPLIVGNVHEGQGNMPPFPDLSAEEVAAVATYIRNAWDNDFGGVATEDVAALIGDMDEDATVTIWSGVYTEDQAERGQQVYGGPCGMCHGRRLNGAADDPDMQSGPALARAPFLRDWNGRSLASLYQYSRSSMPISNPGFLSEQDYADIIAHMLATTGAPTGDTELPTDPSALARIIITDDAP